MRSFRTVYALATLGSSALVVLGTAWGYADNEKKSPLSDEQVHFFETKVRPLLADRCFSCHSGEQPKAGLRLDSREGLMKGSASGMVVTPGDPEKSRLIEVIRYTGKVKMPPAGQLNPDEVGILTAWVKMGAPWPEAKPSEAAQKAAANGAFVITPQQKAFWSFRPVKRPTAPKVKNVAWVKSPIDAFILAGLEKKGLAPAPPADKRTLIRRATYDLTGLPPTPQEVVAFLADRSPNAFAKVVDRLLASPRYGERWGRYWLDVVRYADSNGLDENKAFGNAFRYRDYVVAAFNKDKPYDQFIHEQLAGDLLPTTDDDLKNERITATGFLSLGAKVLAEQDKPKLVMDIVDEQIEVTSKAFMGLTVACARCHNHKFDPIPTKDYYALAGIFKSTRTMADLGFVSNWLERPVASKQDRAQMEAFEKKKQALEAVVRTATQSANEAVLASLRKEGTKYLQAGRELAAQATFGSIAETPARPGDPPRITVDAVKFDRGNANRDFSSYGDAQTGLIHTVAVPTFAEWDVTVPSAGTYQIELRYTAMESRPVRLLVNGQVVRDSTAGQITGSWRADGLRWEAEGAFALKAGKNTLRIERDGSIPHIHRLLVAIVPSTNPDTPAPRTAEQIAAQYGLDVTLIRHVAQRLRSLKPGEAADPQKALTLPEKPEALYSASAKEAIRKAQEALNTAQKSAPRAPVAMAVEEGQVQNVRVHLRGNTLTLGEEAPRRFLTVLAGENQTPIDDKRSGRLELAQWLTSPTHPLTSRVAVNRVWQQHFGEGFVRTPDNFGLLGDRPSHPELLDWLAATFAGPNPPAPFPKGKGEISHSLSRTAGRCSAPKAPLPFREGADGLGWSLKKLHRLIMLSSTYQMSDASNPVAMNVDPDNRLLWRKPRRRLEAEPFRDAMLAISGQMDTTMGGTLLTTPNNDYVTNDQSGNGAGYTSSRRSIYLPIIRNALFDMFQAFDMGDPSIVNAKRASTTVAPQALYVMNSPFVLEQAKHWADRLLAAERADEAARLTLAYQQAFGRNPSALEMTKGHAFLSRLSARLAVSEPDGAKRQEKVWQALCQALFATNEFIYVD